MAKRSHNVRIDEDLWAAAKAAAAAEGRTITDVLVAALRRLVANGPRSRCMECGAEQ
jgi:antitoxin component of RelBE/YafQ-DinJ toxin-antitoxin module